jgi:hypothetical protein
MEWRLSYPGLFHSKNRGNLPDIKLWSYVNSNTELMDIGPAVTNAWHTAYI